MRELPLTIRAVTPEDIETVYEIEKVSFPYPYSPWDFRYYLEVESEFFLVAEWKGKVVGYIVGSKWRELLTVVSLAVMPEYRGLGIGGRLLEALEEKVKGKVKRIELQVRVSNRPAINLYEKKGYERGPVISRYYRNGEDAFLFYKNLEES